RAVMVDAVGGLDQVFGPLLCDCPAGVGVAVEAREVAAGDLQAYTVAGPEDVRGRPNVDLDLVDGARLQQRGHRQRLAVSRPHNAVGQYLGAPIGVDIDELGREVAVRRRGRDI